MLKAVYNFDPKNAIHSLDTQGDSPPFPYPSGTMSSVTDMSTLERLSMTSSLSKPNMMIQFSSVKGRNSQSVVGLQGRDIGSTPKVTGSLLMTGTLKPFSGPTHTIRPNSASTTGTFPQNSPPVLTTCVLCNTRQLHANLSPSMGTLLLLTPMNLLISPIATSALTDPLSKATNCPKIDPKGEGIRKEGQHPPVANTIRKRAAPTTHANSNMSARDAEEITHDTSAQLRATKWFRVGEAVDRSLEGTHPQFLRFAFG